MREKRSDKEGSGDDGRETEEGDTEECKWLYMHSYIP